MTIALATTPTYALKGRVKCTATISGSTGTYVRLWVTAAPEGSTLATLLERSGTDAARVEVAAVDSAEVFELDLDQGGEYVFVGQEYTKGVAGAQGGGYEGDTRSHETETKVGSEQTSLKLYIGDRLTHQVGTPSHGTATLVVYVWNDSIRETTLAVHGVKSPAIVQPTTPQAVSAARNATVLTKVAALVGKTASTLTTNVDTLVAEMITDVPAHFNNTGGTWHSAPDTVNDTEIEDLSTAPGSAVGYARVAQVLANRLRLHMRNGADGSNRVHTYPDSNNQPIVDAPNEGIRSAPSVALAWAALGDVYRAYESHRADSNVHANPDTSNSLGSALGALLDLHQAFMTQLATFAPTTPDGVQAATVQMRNLGFNQET